MAKCSIGLRLDGDAKYHTGDSITGVVTLDAEDDIEAKTITVEQRWQTSGWGSTDAKSIETVTIATDVSVRAGNRAEYPFSVAAPDGPTSYGGHLLQIDQFVRARADIPWTIDPKSEVRYELMPARATLGSHREPYQRHDDATRKWKRFRWIVLAIEAVALWLVPFPSSVAVVVVVLLVAILIGRNTVATRKLGDVSIAIAATRVCPGEELPVHLLIQPPAAVELSSVTAHFAAREWCARGSGKNRRSKTHQILEREVDILGPTTIGRGEPLSVDALLPIPSEPIYSFKASDNEIKWDMKVRIAVPGWPDWSISRTLEVVAGTPAVIARLVAGTGART